MSKMLEIDHQNRLMFVENKNMYLGLLASDGINELEKNFNIPQRYLKAFYLFIRHFFIVLVSQFAKFLRIKSLQSVFERFPVLKRFIYPQKLDQEWRLHGLNHEEYQLDPSLSPEDNWCKVFQLKNASNTKIFIDLEKVIGLLLVLPFSNASVERLFSQLKLTKTLHRNQLKNETLNAILSSREGIEDGSLISFNPKKKNDGCENLELIFFVKKNL